MGGKRLYNKKERGIYPAIGKADFANVVFYISLKKKWSDAEVRSNFEVEKDEFINMTFLNSEWLHYAILNKKIGNFIINGKSVSYAYAVRYMKLAYEYLIKRETGELALRLPYVIFVRGLFIFGKYVIIHTIFTR